ncbi:2-(3-amino-3-carboxypropyl)histidine synthase subunit 2 isoform X1 [Senna tora]|uniref:2-(3-amino-3-carboxypropyl)histidine synthase subunit 2 isoform X1 n=1 Tax=Senna tora TaxID=362788 RepID=A0A834WEN9_9FABA|nr:2-(3-amino-3-carboxypropyl)histidine synthase subunit 2 isoform X1 [Senna tora]
MSNIVLFGDEWMDGRKEESKSVGLEWCRCYLRIPYILPSSFLKRFTKLRKPLNLSDQNEIPIFTKGVYGSANTTVKSTSIDIILQSNIYIITIVHIMRTLFSFTIVNYSFLPFGNSTLDVTIVAQTLTTLVRKKDEHVLMVEMLGLAVGASHINADCVIHYGHTCFSPNSVSLIIVLYSFCSNEWTTTLPAFFVFGKASISIADCVEIISKYALSYSKPIMEPASRNSYSVGGLTWKLPEGRSMDDYLIFWIGCDNSAFANAVLTFNACEIVRYDATENQVVTDMSQQRRILKRRYYLVERAKDANIIGILVGTLGVAGYLHIIHQMKELITGAGKKAYTMVMGKPNPAKLANFPECDVFVYVSCAQTALLDSKEYLAPVITPFEATIAFSRGSQWTGAYVMEFRNLIDLPQVEVGNQEGEARFSFLRGGYVEDADNQENGKEETEALALVNATEKALQLRDNCNSLIKGDARSGAEFFATRSYQGLNMDSQNSSPELYFVGRKGRASEYEDEKSRH